MERSFFDPNVLSCDENGSERSEWFDCSCCPSNLARFIPSVPGYVYATSSKGFYVNLYGANHADVVLKNGNACTGGTTDGLSVEWKDKVDIDSGNPGRFCCYVAYSGMGK